MGIHLNIILNLSLRLSACIYLLHILPFRFGAGACEYEYTAYNATNYITSHDGYGLHQYPSSYIQCWKITANVSDQIVLLNITMSVEHHAYCNYDRLIIYDSDSAYGTYLLKCGYDAFTIHSSGRSIYLEFETDSSTRDDGFIIYYSQTERNNYNASDWSGSFYLAPPANSTSLTSYQIIGIVAGLVLVISIIFLVVVGIIIYNCSNGRVEGEPVPVNSQDAHRGGVPYNHRTELVGVALAPPAYSQHAANSPPGYNNEPPAYSEQHTRQGPPHPFQIQEPPPPYEPPKLVTQQQRPQVQQQTQERREEHSLGTLPSDTAYPPVVG